MSSVRLYVVVIRVGIERSLTVNNSWGHVFRHARVSWYIQYVSNKALETSL